MKASIKIRWAIIITLVGVLVFICLRPKGLASLAEKQSFWVNKVHGDGPCDLIVFGDSRTLRGVNPAYFKSFQGLNFAFQAGGLNPEIFRAGWSKLNGKSKVAIIGVTPFALTPKSTPNKQFRETNTLPFDAVFYRKKLTPFFSFFDPTEPTDLAAQILGVQGGIRQEYHTNGWVATAVEKTFQKNNLSSVQGAFSDNQISGALVDSLLNLVKISKQAGGIIFGFSPPISEELKQLEKTYSSFDELTFKQQFEKSGGVWLDINPLDYECYDDSHLNAAEAEKLSQDLWQKMKPYVTR